MFEIHSGLKLNRLIRWRRTGKGRLTLFKQPSARLGIKGLGRKGPGDRRAAVQGANGISGRPL
jgi:hypothetical protein